MGWRSWNAMHADVTQAKMQRTMDRMVARSRKVVPGADTIAGTGTITGTPSPTRAPSATATPTGAAASLLDVGYNSCGLDDAWQACGAGEKGTFYGADGSPIVNTTTFPDLKAMTSHGHSHGLYVGWCVETKKASK